MTKKEYDRQYYLKNRNVKLENAKKYALSHPKKLKRYRKRYYWSHKIESSYVSRIYRMNHPAKIKSDSAKYYRENRERILEYKRRYHKEHPECSIATRENRRARSKSAGKLTVKQVQEVYENNIKRFGTLTCYLCYEPIAFGNDSLEHKTPLSRGGTNELGNLEIAHQKCNSAKNSKTEEEYREYLKCLH